MIISALSVPTAGKFTGLVAALVASFWLLQLPGAANTDTLILFHQDGQWEAQRVLQLSPQVMAALEADEENVSRYARQISALKTAAANEALNFTYTEQPRSDGWTVVTGVGSGQGLDLLNNLMFDGRAELSVQLVNGQREVSLFAPDLDPVPVTAAGGADSWRLLGNKIMTTNADEVQLNRTAIWLNPVEISLNVTEIATPPANTLLAAVEAAAPPTSPDAGAAQPVQGQAVNLIRNGDFEAPWPQEDGVAAEWAGYDNGRAHFGFYEETWPEAVWRGERAQLMEIFEHEPNVTDRVIAIYQTVDVTPNSVYDLTFYAIMRSTADRELRGNDELQLAWGIDPTGEGNYDNVANWTQVAVTEQNRLGSNGAFLDDAPLFYEEITGTVRTEAATNRVSLFIRGLKKFPNNVEVNFDIDDVSLVGPVASLAAPSAAEPVSPKVQEPAAAPPAEDATLPSSGAVTPPPPASVGMIALGGLVLVIIGTGAAAGLLRYRRRE